MPAKELSRTRPVNILGLPSLLRTPVAIAAVQRRTQFGPGARRDVSAAAAKSAGERSLHHGLAIPTCSS